MFFVLLRARAGRAGGATMVERLTASARNLVESQPERPGNHGTRGWLGRAGSRCSTGNTTQGGGQDLGRSERAAPLAETWRDATTSRHDQVVSRGSERRHDDRVAIELSVEYKRLNAFFADYTKNISRGGTFIRTEKPLAIGTEFVFKLRVPGLEHPMELRGKVQWIVEPSSNPGSDPGMGIGFVWENEAERERIANAVEKLMVGSLGSVIYDKLVGRRRRGEDG